MWEGFHSLTHHKISHLILLFAFVNNVWIRKKERKKVEEIEPPACLSSSLFSNIKIISKTSFLHSLHFKASAVIIIVVDR